LTRKLTIFFWFGSSLVTGSSGSHGSHGSGGSRTSSSGGSSRSRGVGSLTLSVSHDSVFGPDGEPGVGLGVGVGAGVANAGAFASSMSSNSVQYLVSLELLLYADRAREGLADISFGFQRPQQVMSGY